MEQISPELIDLQWKNIEKIDLDEIPSLVNMLGKNQPFILAYLMATGSDILNQKEREVLLFMGIMVWNIIKQFTYSNPVEITTAELIEKEMKNITMLEYLSGEPESDFGATVQKLMSTFHQNHLLSYILDRIMDEVGIEAEKIRDDNAGMIFIYLKSVIDCLDSVH